MHIYTNQHQQNTTQFRSRLGEHAVGTTKSPTGHHVILTLYSEVEHRVIYTNPTKPN